MKNTPIVSALTAFILVFVLASASAWLFAGFAKPAHAQEGTVVSGTTYNDYSGTITSGGTAQTAVPLQPNRRSIYIQNLSSDALWINFTSTAAATTAGSIYIPQYGTFAKDNPLDVTPEAVSVVAATTGDKFTIKTN